jgi:hypothetical protein
VRNVRLDLARPAWLVLAQSYDPAWRATCDGRSLGPSRPAAAYANGWRAPAGCAAVTFTYAPDRPVRLAMLASGAACLLLLALLVIRRRPATVAAAPAGWDVAAADRPDRRGWRAAARAGLLAGLVAAALIALRAGPLVAVAVALVVRYGVGARPLILAAAALLGVAVPAVQLIALPRDRGGYYFGYATELVAAHWVAVAALVALAVALWRTVSARRRPAPAPSERASRDPAAGPPGPAAGA